MQGRHDLNQSRKVCITIIYLLNNDRTYKSATQLGRTELSSETSNFKRQS